MHCRPGANAGDHTAAEGDIKWPPPPRKVAFGP
jgi:hypothetical protein